MNKNTFTIQNVESSTIVIGDQILKNLSTILKDFEYTSYTIICSKTSMKLFAKDIEKALRPFEKTVSIFSVEDGEKAKEIDTLIPLLQKMSENNVDRKGAIIALGGGVVGDIATVIAGLYYRGIDCIQIPTTLLSQVDSATGGKGAINIGVHKNTIGVIRQPRVVVIDTSLIASLPQEQFTSGMGEVLKYAVAMDKKLFEKLEKMEELNKSLLMQIITRCINLKMKIVKKDQSDTKGVRAIVNFGHTLGQALELLAKIPHGYAVSIGMVFAIKVSVRMRFLENSEEERIIKLIQKYKLPTRIQGLSLNTVSNQMIKDKKTINNIPRFVLLSGIGKTKINQLVPKEIIISELKEVLI